MGMPLDPGDLLRCLHVCLGGGCQEHGAPLMAQGAHSLFSPLLPLTSNGFASWKFQLLSHQSTTWTHLTGGQSESGTSLQSFNRDGCGIKVGFEALLSLEGSY